MDNGRKLEVSRILQNKGFKTRAISILVDDCTSDMADFYYPKASHIQIVDRLAWVVVFRGLNVTAAELF